MATFGQRVWAVVKSISVEPVSMLVSTSFMIAMTASGLGMYRVMCDQMFNADGGSYLNNHSAFQCWNMSIGLGAGLGGNGTEWWKKAEVILQQNSATYATISLISSLLPCGLANVVLGGIGDRRGRKGVLLLSIVGYAIAVVPFVILFNAPTTTPIYVVYIFNFVAGLTGQHLGLAMSSAGYLTDVTTDKNMLTIRMAILQACSGVASVSAPLIAIALVTATSFTWTCVIAIGIDGLAFLAGMFLLKRIIPGKREKAVPTTSEMNDSDDTSPTGIDSINGSSEDICGKVDPSMGTNNPVISEPIDAKTAPNNRSFFSEVKDILKQVKQSFVDAWRAITKKREGHKKAYIMVAFYLAFVLAAIDLTVNRYATLYLQKTPFSWSQSEVANFESATNLIQLLGGFLFLAVAKKCFAISDTLILSISLLSYTAKSVVFILATTNWMIYVSSAIGVFSGLALPCMQTFMALLLDPDELGKMFGFSSVFAAVSIILGTVLIGEIYKATVATFASCVFVIGAAMTASALVLSIWLYLDSKRGFKSTSSKSES